MKTGMAIIILLNLNKDRDITVLLVTHNPELAKQTEIQFHLGGGKLQKQFAAMNLLRTSLIRDLLTDVFLNLFRKRMRALLTMTGVIIGSFLVVLIFSLQWVIDLS